MGSRILMIANRILLLLLLFAEPVQLPCKISIFFFFENKVSQFYFGKSDWKTSSKSCGSSSNHTSVTAVKTALLAREWAKLLPPY